jgi:hypothetical protein
MAYIFRSHPVTTITTPQNAQTQNRKTSLMFAHFRRGDSIRRTKHEISTLKKRRK